MMRYEDDRSESEDGDDTITATAAGGRDAFEILVDSKQQSAAENLQR